MSTPQEFKSWAVVELMGHVTYAGFVQAEVIAGASMLRVDVPPVKNYPAYTKYVSPAALYGLTPVDEETARAKADALRAQPFEAWSVGRAIENGMRERGLLKEEPALELVPPPGCQECHMKICICPDEESEYGEG